MFCTLLSRDTAALPLSRQLATAAVQLASMINAGELAALPGDTRGELVGLGIFLHAAGHAAGDLEERLRSPSRRERRVTPIGDLVARIARRARP